MTREIGDKGERFRVVCWDSDAKPPLERVLGFCPTKQGALYLARTWSMRLAGHRIWVEDRAAREAIDPL